MAIAYRLKLTLDAAAVDKYAGALAFREVTTVTRRVFNRANVLTPVDTNRLRAGNQMRVRRVGNATTGEVWNDVEYAMAVHQGVKNPVVIVPVRRKALRFKVDGRWVYARRVTLPPRRGRPFMLRALREVAAASGYTVVA